MPRVSVDIVGDADSLLRALNRSVSGFGRFDQALRASTAESRASATARVGAVVKLDESLRSQITAYREVAAAAEKGSREQLVAARLAERAQVSLSRSFGVTTAESRALSRSSGGVERDLGRATRGALAGSGVFRGLGRSIAFASGGFLAFASAGQAIRTSIDAAKEAGVTQKQLAAQFRASGIALKTYQGVIDKTNLRLSALAGINKNDLDQSFITIFRGTNNVAKALKDEAVAADIAAGHHIALSTASIAVGKAAAGSTTSLKRLGIELPKGTTGVQALAIAAERFRGQAAAAATQQQKFGAVLHDSEVIIGAGLLPTLNKYLAGGAQWLTQMNESGKLQKDVAHATHDLRAAISDAAAVFRTARGVIEGVDKVTGSFKHTLEGLIALRVGFAVAGWTRALAGIGGASRAAAAEAGGLRAALLGVGAPEVLAALATAAAALAGFKLGEKLGNEINKLLGRSPEQGPTAASIKKALTAPPGYQPGSYGKRPSTPENPGGFIPSSTVAPKGFRPGTYGEGLSTPGNPGGFLPTKKPDAKETASPPTKRPLSLQGRFNLDELRLADAQRRRQVALQRAILVDEENITLRLRDQAKTLKARTAFAQQAASLEDQIRGIDQTAASNAAAAARKAKEAAAKRKAAADKAAKLAAAFSVPLSLQVADARALALGKPEKTILVKIKAATEKALKSGRLGLQGQLDAWNELASVNDQIKNAIGANPLGKFREANLRKLTAGLGLPRAELKRLEARLSQVGIGGHIPNKGVGAFGFQIGGSGTVVVHTHVHLDGKQVAKTVTNHQIKRKRRNSSQSRGPFAGADN